LELEDNIDIKKKPLFANSKNMNIDFEAIRELNEFAKFTKSKGAEVFFMYPTIPEIVYTRYLKEVKNVSTFLAKELEFPILNTPTSHNLNDIYFYDTVYHLNKKGRKMRTLQIIEDLKSMFQKKTLVNSKNNTY